MYTPLVRLRSTAYHMVVASSLPWIRSHGRGGGSTSFPTPAAINWPRVAI